MIAPLVRMQTLWILMELFLQFTGMHMAGRGRSHDGVVYPVRPRAATSPPCRAPRLGVDLQLSRVTSAAFLARDAGAAGGLVAACGRRAGRSTRPPAEQVLEPVHQPRLEPAPDRVRVPGDGGCEVLAVPEPAARDAEAGGFAGGRAVDRGGGVLLLFGAAEAGAEAGELALEGLDAGAGGLHGRSDVRGLAQHGVALEDIAQRHARGVRDAAARGGGLEERRRGDVVVAVGEQHGVVGVELLHEHGLHDEAEREARVLDQVHEDVL
jgi:hypothetical protein